MENENGGRKMSNEKLFELANTKTTKEFYEVFFGQEPKGLTFLFDLWENKYSVPAPVINFAMAYVGNQTNRKFSKPYFEKIISHWARLQLKTANEAFNIAKEHKRKYEHWGVSK